MFDFDKIATPESLIVPTFEQAQASVLESVQQFIQDYDPIESDDYKLLIDAFAYHSLLERQKTVNAAKAQLLAFASGLDLQHKALDDGLELLENETEEEFRQRIWLSKDRHSTAGSIDAYKFFTRSASGDIKDSDCLSPTPLEIIIPILSKTGNGTASQALIDLVNTALSYDTLRPEGDIVTVQSAEIIEYEINAVLHIDATPATAELIRSNAEQSAVSYADQQHKLAGKISLNKLNGVLDDDNINDIDLINFTPIEASRTQAPYCTAINISIAGSQA